ncbi:MAG: phytanoyl-CoA dioxygenase family protein [Caulobacteraceae bacterium]
MSIQSSGFPSYSEAAGSAPRSQSPTTPWVETDQLDHFLASIDADVETRRFCTQLAITGLGSIDLGEAGRQLVDQVVAETDPYFKNPKVTRVQDAWLRSKAVRRLATSPKLMGMLRAAYGRRPFAFQTLSFQRGTQQSLHSDAIHFHRMPERFMCGVWIALEDISPASGPLTYVAGSHKLPVLTMQGAGVNDTPREGDYERFYLPALRHRLDASNMPQEIAAPRKGEAVVWAANLAHGGAPILDAALTRKSLVVHVYFEGCLFYTPMLSDPQADQYDVRLPLNVATGGCVWPRRDGRRVAVPRSALAEAAQRILFRRPVIHADGADGPA